MTKKTFFQSQSLTTDSLGSFIHSEPVTEVRGRVYAKRLGLGPMTTWSERMKEVCFPKGKLNW